MKNLITCTACVILLMAFTVELAHYQQLYLQLVMMSRYIAQFEEKVSEEGNMELETKEWICKKVADIMECKKEEVTVKYQKNKAGKNVSVGYELTFPINRVLASPQFWGIDEKINSGEKTVSGEIKLKE